MKWEKTRFGADADPDTAYHVDADPDPTFQFDADLCGSGSTTLLEPVLRIHDILGWIQIRIRGSMPLTYGSGSCYFRH